MFQPRLEQHIYPSPVGKIVCVGRSYAAHAAELNNPVPAEPILFIKPADAACALGPVFAVPQGMGSVHHELEIAVLIGETLSNASEETVLASLAGVGIGLDLTLRDVQDGLKAKSLPWEIAKSFDGACPLSDFIAADKVEDWADIEISLIRNGKVQQEGNSSAMLFPIIALIARMSRHFTLNPGDVIMTGTPAGVGPLEVGDELEAHLQDWLVVNTHVKGRDPA